MKESLRASVGICPVCKKAVLLKRKVLYYTCPFCSSVSSSTASAALLEGMCLDPVKTTQVLKLCIDTEAKHGIDIPTRILDVLQKHHPYNEDIAYMRVRFSKYSYPMVRDYLNAFAGIKRTVPFAEELLDKILRAEYMPWASQILQYIENKLPPSQQKSYKERLNELKSNYIIKPITKAGIYQIFAYYIIGSLVNLVLSIFFIFILDWAIYIFLAMTLGAFFVEIGLLFLHHRAYGNRIDISKNERLLMVIFMCSLMVTICSMVIGVFV